MHRGHLGLLGRLVCRVYLACQAHLAQRALPEHLALPRLRRSPIDYLSVSG